MTRSLRWVLRLAVCAQIGWHSTALAAEVRVAVHDASGRPLPDAVVALSNADSIDSRTAKAVMDQRNKQFDPYVLPVGVGTSVSFPNSDQTRHHVYSFSEAKPFELKLYAGFDAPPVRFDRAGVVVLGCNIHDHMIGYIYVLPESVFSVTGADGVARFPGLADGSYPVRVLHPRLAAPETPAPVRVEQGKAAPLRIQTPLQPDPSAESHESDDPLQHLFDKAHP